MFALALVFILSGEDIKSEIIGVYHSLSECQAASKLQSSATRCYYLDPEKGIVEPDKNGK
ncbi:YebW family protein [Escherichia coli]|uniref:YebW family protein n=1 Tax=Escherichia coli TaxID=562 RepID=UPI0020970E36|nr:YebW family protein [Escherichia coli]